MNRLQEFVRDQRGSTSPIGVVLVTTIVAIGSIVGLATIRDHIIQQLGDSAVALRNLRQSYRYSVSIDANRDGDSTDPEDCVLSGGFVDAVDLVDDPGDAPACLNLTIAPTDES